MELSQFEKLAAEHFGLTNAGPARPMVAGNINRTALISSDDGDFVLQDINTSVFVDPAVVMANHEKIVERQQQHNLSTLHIRETVSGDCIAFQDGSPWRCYAYVDGEATPSIRTRAEAQATARAFGRYARAIDGLDLVEHIPGYHNFDQRVAVFYEVLEADELGRLSGCERHVEDLIAMIDRLRLTSAYEAWLEAPVRNAHNDAKGPNCIIGSTGRTIIDLDTTMPGNLLADIGELVRSSTRHLDNAGPEELMGQITSVNRGFLAGYDNQLTEAETSAMLLSGPLMAVENSVRFLADHLSGDKYYGASTLDENRERAVVQLRLAERLVESIELATSGALAS